MCSAHPSSPDRRHRFAPFLATLLAVTAAQGTVLYVDDDAPPAGNGLTWPTACRFFQDALAIASIPENGITEIRVAQGFYTADRDENNPDGSGECFLPHGGPGCPDADCEAAVCAVLPLCCAVGWDETCVTAALDVCGDARAATFQLINDVALLGGYAGLSNPGDPDARDVELYETILSGDLAGNDGPGLFDNNDENSLHVTTGSGTDVTAVIDGFTITAGNANGPGWPELDADAGGMLNDAGSPWINDCRLEANWATEAGAGMSNNWGSHPTVSDCAFRYNAVDQSESPHTSGGMYNWHSDPTITNCLFESNSAGDGGGMGNEQSSPTITGCQFIGNSAWSGGGGMINLAASPTVTDCVFLNNTVDQTAWPRTSGGMYNGFGSNSTVTDCLFQGNSAGDGGGMGNEQCSPTITNCQFIDNSAGVNHGGAIINVGSSPRITDCEFIENSATLYGGAIRNSGDSTTTVTGCTFDRNTAQWGAGIGSYQSTDTVDTCTFTGNSAQHGGGMGFQEAAPTVVNCLLVDNTAVDYGGGMVTWTAGHPTVINSTFRNNTGAIGAGVYNHEPDGVVMRNCIVWENNGEEIAGALALVSHSDIQGGYPGDGNIDADPLFVDPANDYYRLSAGSPCIDAGDNEAVPTGQNTDLDGNLRFVDDPCKVDTGSPPDDAPYVDMGAYEFQGCSCDLNGDGSVGVNDFLILLAAWGPCADCNNCPADFDGDCEVGVTDFLQLLANWGPCP